MKKILYLSHRIPYPPNKGDKIRSFNEVKYLSKKYIVDLITFADNPRDLKYSQNLKQYCRKIKVFSLNTKKAKLKGIISLLYGKSITQGYFYSKKFQDTFNHWTKTEHYDSIICFSSPMAEYIFRSESTFKNLTMDFCDLDSDKWLQYSKKKKFPASLLFKTEAARLLKYEKKVNQAFNNSIFVSNKEADLFFKYFPKAKNITVIPNGVDHDYFNPAQIKESNTFNHPMIMFSGAMDYYANVDGVLWFTKQILPEIKKDIPNIQFYIVGSNPAPEVCALNKNPSITVTGFVKDIRQYYKAADLCVIPLRIARGVQNKVLEALSMDKPVLSTSTAVQGLCPGVKTVLQIEDDPVKFARKTTRLIKKHSKAGARQFILDHYNWENSLHNLDIKSFG